MVVSIGEIRQGKELGFPANQQYERFIWLECPVCHNCRWVALRHYRKAERDNRVLMCKECNGFAREEYNGDNSVE